MSPDSPQNPTSPLPFEIAAGTFFYSRYPYPRPVYYQFAWSGQAVVHRLDETRNEILCEPGESWFFIAGGPEYPQSMEHIEAALREGGEALLTRTREHWRGFSSLSRASSRFAKTVDDVAVLIKTQQCAEGGVLAGHNYHLAYVRDQYGVSRGLLAMGHIVECRQILKFYWEIWQRFGKIHNAQAVGVEGVFHIHENDEVEITAYLIQQAFDYLHASGDEAFLREILPMLEWAFRAQTRHILQNMLPFNGDETYIAGSILPRTVLNDGSAEATLLFIESGDRLLEWAADHNLWQAENLQADRELLARMKADYRANFWVNGQMAANNPARAGLPGGSPRFRHGVCERCMAEGHFETIGWTERSRTGRYLCPACLAKGDYPPVEPARYFLQSVSLTPLYFRSRFLAKEELRPTVEAILNTYQQTGKLPSRPDDERGIAVGYDYGLLLFALVELKHPAAAEIAEKTHSLVDATGSWAEYYLHHQPQGTRYRPWESAINLESLLKFAHPLQSEKGRST